MAPGGGHHRIASLLYSSDERLREQGRDELRRALERHGGVTPTARALGVPERSVWRWVERAGIVPPDARTSGVTDCDIVEAINQYGSLRAAARALGLSHTHVRRRAITVGYPTRQRRKT